MSGEIAQRPTPGTEIIEVNTGVDAPDFFANVIDRSLNGGRVTNGYPVSVEINRDKLEQLVSDYNPRIHISCQLPAIHLVFEKLRRCRLGVFEASMEDKTIATLIEIDVGNIIINLCKGDQKEERFVRAIKNGIIKSLSHEIGHWYMFNTNPLHLVDHNENFKERVISIFLTFIAWTVMLVGGISIMDSLNYSKIGLGLAISFMALIMLEFLAMENLYNTAVSIAERTVYLTSKSERFARKFEKWARTDNRWQAVVDVRLKN